METVETALRKRVAQYARKHGMTRESAFLHVLAIMNAEFAERSVRAVERIADQLCKMKQS